MRFGAARDSCLASNNRRPAACSEMPIGLGVLFLDLAALVLLLSMCFRVKGVFSFGSEAASLDAPPPLSNIAQCV